MNEEQEKAGSSAEPPKSILPTSRVTRLGEGRSESDVHPIQNLRAVTNNPLPEFDSALRPDVHFSTYQRLNLWRGEGKAAKSGRRLREEGGVG